MGMCKGSMHSGDDAGAGDHVTPKYYLHAGRGGKPARRYSQNYLHAGRGGKPARRAQKSAVSRF